MQFNLMFLSRHEKVKYTPALYMFLSSKRLQKILDPLKSLHRMSDVETFSSHFAITCIKSDGECQSIAVPRQLATLHHYRFDNIPHILSYLAFLTFFSYGNVLEWTML